MDTTYINALILPLFATWFIPVSIRDAKSGEYLGFFTKRVGSLILILVLLESMLVIQQHGISRYAINSIILYITMPIAGAFVFVKYTQKQLFKNEIKFTKWW